MRNVFFNPKATAYVEGLFELSKKAQSSTGFNIQRLLGAVDTSDNARRATNAAVDLAVKYQAELIVLHVMPRLTYEFIPVSLSAPPSLRPGLEDCMRRPRKRRRSTSKKRLQGQRTEELMPRERSWRKHLNHPSHNGLCLPRERGLDSCRFKGTKRIQETLNRKCFK